MRCQHSSDCTSLACPCICNRCIYDRLEIYAEMYPEDPIVQVFRRTEPLWPRIRRRLRRSTQK